MNILFHQIAAATEYTVQYGVQIRKDIDEAGRQVCAFIYSAHKKTKHRSEIYYHRTHQPQNVTRSSARGGKTLIHLGII